MSVQKFRSVSDMPRPERARGADVIRRIRVLWRRARVLAPPVVVPRGVTRFRSIEDANAARDAATILRMRASRART